MKIAIIVEGATEQAFRAILIQFLRTRLPREQRPQLRMIPQQGRVPKEERLKRLVDNLLNDYDAVIALTDVYTGTDDFKNAEDAKQKMRQWVGERNGFYPHVALHDFESWLIPYWETIQRLSGSNRNAPAGQPERINHNRPPSYHIKEVFEVRTARDSYNKPRDAARILRDNDLLVAANACPELKAFLNTILALCGSDPL